MKITILGSGTAVPSLQRNSSGVLIQDNGVNSLVDFGYGNLRQLLNLGITYHDIDRIFFTHNHPDHMCDLIPFLFGAVTAKAADIVDTAVSAGQFNTLVTAVQAAGLVETLKSDGPFTVFAPTDAAFAKLPAGTVENLLKPENKDQLISVLTYHVVSGKIMSADIAGKIAMVQTVQGSKVSVNATDGRYNLVMVDAAKVVSADIETSNGVIHVIDTVLLPN